MNAHIRSDEQFFKLVPHLIADRSAVKEVHCPGEPCLPAALQRLRNKVSYLSHLLQKIQESENQLSEQFFQQNLCGFFIQRLVVIAALW